MDVVTVTLKALHSSLRVRRIFLARLFSERHVHGVFVCVTARRVDDVCLLVLNGTGGVGDWG